MIFDLLGQRERAVNEYSKAKQTNDNTGSAQETAGSLPEKNLQRRCAGRFRCQPTGEAAPALRRPTMDGHTSKSHSRNRR